MTSEIPHKTGHERVMSVRRTGRIYAPGEYATIEAAEVTSAPPDVAIGLGVEPGAPAIRRHRITRNADGTIESASVSWYDGALADVAPRLLTRERIIEGSWAYLETQTGRRAVRGTEVFDVRLADEKDAEDLGISLPAALKVATLTLRDADGNIVEYGISVTPKGRKVAIEFDLPE